MNLLKIIVNDKNENEVLRTFITEEEYQYVFNLNDGRWGNIEDYKSFWKEDLKTGSFTIHTDDKSSYKRLMVVVKIKQENINNSIEQVLK